MQLLCNCSTHFYKRLDFYISSLYYKIGKWKIFLDVIMWKVPPGDHSYLFGLKRPPKGSSKLRKFHPPALLWKTAWDARVGIKHQHYKGKTPTLLCVPCCCVQSPLFSSASPSSQNVLLSSATPGRSGSKTQDLPVAFRLEK